MIFWNASAAGNDMCPSVIFLLKSDKVILSQQYSIQHAAWSIFLSYVAINYSQICFMIELQLLSPFYAKIQVIRLQ